MIKTYKLFLFMVALIMLSLLSCRPEIQNEAPVEQAKETAPAQVVTPTPTPTPAPTPAPTPTPTPTSIPTPIKIPPLPPGVKILTPMPIPPGVDMSPPKPPATLPPLVGTLKIVTTELVGPSTMGGKVYLGGALPIQLPADAYIERIVTTVDCGVGVPCPQTPVYGIRRGKSRLSFSAGNGEVLFEEIAQGEFGAFDFLTVLRRKTPSPTTTPPTTVPSPPVTGLASKGTSIEIAGKSIKLPDNAYIDAFIVSIYCPPRCRSTASP